VNGRLRSRSRLLTAALAFSVALLLWCGGGSGCSRLDLARVDTTALERPSQQLFQATIRFYDLYGLQSELRAVRIDQYLKRHLFVMPQGFELVTWDSLGQEDGTLRADSGTYDEQKEDVRAIGNVIVTSQQGLKLETGWLEWDNQRRRIITEDSVCFTTAQDTLYGVGFVSNRDLTNWEIGDPTGFSYRELEEEPRE